MRTIEEIIQDMKSHGTSPEMIDKDIAELEEVLSKWNNTELRGKITLRDARTNLGWSLEEASEKIGISVNRLRKYEEDNRKMPSTFLIPLSNVYKISMAHFYIGKTQSFKKKNHLNMSLAGR
ncbi:helix-turn-helix transcriptional regulator [Paenibacillus alvei]|uniref:Helix-turn-helix transcriptional regulator n=1 Tax=Paenibacillus alvei TaxID=44250 RepID=A0ABT4H7Q6_PAEAL|nr:helix-turn-helix transcriptional regulator [Paenibacillus alvei]MCY9764803.1 helix-turn-helix transcriptional regulator [Paenibacillus alvei]MCY9770710.1 helix-turn-helix transcriptional regulator [Paenibacillus alvei]